jgi:hypothetical protein
VKHVKFEIGKKKVLLEEKPHIKITCTPFNLCVDEIRRDDETMNTDFD